MSSPEHPPRGGDDVSDGGGQPLPMSGGSPQERRGSVASSSSGGGGSDALYNTEARSVGHPHPILLRVPSREPSGHTPKKNRTGGGTFLETGGSPRRGNPVANNALIAEALTVLKSVDDDGGQEPPEHAAGDGERSAAEGARASASTEFIEADRHPLPPPAADKARSHCSSSSSRDVLEVDDEMDIATDFESIRGSSHSAPAFAVEEEDDEGAGREASEPSVRSAHGNGSLPRGLRISSGTSQASSRSRRARRTPTSGASSGSTDQGSSAVLHPAGPTAPQESAPPPAVEGEGEGAASSESKSPGPDSRRASGVVVSSDAAEQLAQLLLSAGGPSTRAEEAPAPLLPGSSRGSAKGHGSELAASTVCAESNNSSIPIHPHNDRDDAAASTTAAGEPASTGAGAAAERRPPSADPLVLLFSHDSVAGVGDGDNNNGGGGSAPSPVAGRDLATLSEASGAAAPHADTPAVSSVTGGVEDVDVSKMTHASSSSSSPHSTSAGEESESAFLRRPEPTTAASSSAALSDGGAAQPQAEAFPIHFADGPAPPVAQIVEVEAEPPRDAAEVAGGQVVEDVVAPLEASEDAFYSFDDDDASAAERSLPLRWRDASWVMNSSAASSRTPPPDGLPRPQTRLVDPLTGLPIRSTAPPRGRAAAFTPVEPATSLLHTPLSEGASPPSHRWMQREREREAEPPRRPPNLVLQTQPTDIAAVIHSFLDTQDAKALGAMADVEAADRLAVEASFSEGWWAIAVEEATAFGVLCADTPQRRRERRRAGTFLTPPRLSTPSPSQHNTSRDSDGEYGGGGGRPSPYDFNMPRSWGGYTTPRAATRHWRSPRDGALQLQPLDESPTHEGRGGDVSRRSSLGLLPSLRSQASSIVANVSALCADEMLYRSYIEDKQSEALYLLARIHQCVIDALQPAHIYLLERSSRRALEAEARRSERHVLQHFSHAAVDEEIRLFRSAVRQRATLIELEDRARTTVLPVEEARERAQLLELHRLGLAGLIQLEDARRSRLSVQTREAIERAVYDEKLSRERLRIDEVRHRARIYTAEAAMGSGGGGIVPSTPTPDKVRDPPRRRHEQQQFTEEEGEEGEEGGVEDVCVGSASDTAVGAVEDGCGAALPEVAYYIDDAGNLRSILNSTPRRGGACDADGDGDDDGEPRFFEWEPTSNSAPAMTPARGDATSPSAHSHEGLVQLSPGTHTSSVAASSGAAAVGVEEGCGDGEGRGRSETVRVTPAEAQTSALLHALRQTEGAGGERGPHRQQAHGATPHRRYASPPPSEPDAAADVEGQRRPTPRSLPPRGEGPTPNRHVVPCSLRPFPHKSYTSVIRGFGGGGRARPYSDDVVYLHDATHSQPTPASLGDSDSDGDSALWSTTEVGARSPILASAAERAAVTASPPPSSPEGTPLRVSAPPPSGAHVPPTPSPPRQRARSRTPRYVAPTAASLRHRQDSALRRVLAQVAVDDTPTRVRCSPGGGGATPRRGAHHPLVIARVPQPRGHGAWSAEVQPRNPYGPGPLPHRHRSPAGRGGRRPTTRRRSPSLSPSPATADSGGHSGGADYCEAATAPPQLFHPPPQQQRRETEERGRGRAQRRPSAPSTPRRPAEVSYSDSLRTQTPEAVGARLARAYGNHNRGAPLRDLTPPTPSLLMQYHYNSTYRPYPSY